MADRYHHGDLRRTLLDHAAQLAAEGNPESITLRGLARRVGVTHSAPLHHFGTREHLLTELATEGFHDLCAALDAHPTDITAMGNAYVAWALSHPGHYVVMWQPRLVDETSPAFLQERQRAWSLLSGAVSAASGASPTAESSADAIAAFAIVHGLSSIWLNGVLTRPADATELTALVTRRLRVGDH